MNNPNRTCKTAQQCYTPSTLTTEQAFQRYEDIRDRLPKADFPENSILTHSLQGVANHVDAFVLDAFGVLNVGQTPIPDAVNRMAELRATGKKLVVLTNGASDPRTSAIKKYHKLGFDFGPHEVVASREVCGVRLTEHLPNGRWGAICAKGDDFTDLNANIVAWNSASPVEVDAFILLSSEQLNEETYVALRDEIVKAPRPVLVANPDIVAPREEGLTLEPGFFAHRLIDETSVKPVFFGKPFMNAYDDVKECLRGTPPHRIAMVGDTLHTDILGGAAAGFRTVLISNFGLFANHDAHDFIDRSGIRPDFVCKVT